MSKGRLVETDATALFDLARRLDGMSKPIQRSIRLTLTRETAKVVSAVRQEVLSIPVKGASPLTFSSYRKNQKSALGAMQGALSFQQDGGIRQAIARGVRSSIRYGSATRGASIVVTGSSSHLPADKKAMNKLLNLEKWRHPVFARGGKTNNASWKWIDQKGHPFWKVTFGFRQPIHEALVKAVEKSITEEMYQSRPMMGI